MYIINFIYTHSLHLIKFLLKIKTILKQNFIFATKPLHNDFTQNI